MFVCPLAKVGYKYSMDRPLCAACNQRLVAINYIKDGLHHYRRRCDQCARKGKKLVVQPPTWYKLGYRKKERCDKCGWRAKFPDKQMLVYHADGNLRNNNDINLKTVCLNCRVELAASKLPWRESEVKPDF